MTWQCWIKGWIWSWRSLQTYWIFSYLLRSNSVIMWFCTVWWRNFALKSLERHETKNHKQLMWGKETTYRGRNLLLVWIVNREGCYRKFLTRGVWGGGFLPSHSYVQLWFCMYIFSNRIALSSLLSLITFSSLICKFYAMSDSYNLWDISFSVDTCSLFSPC